jgi:transcriptional regulator with XRE-family HTH domain
MASLSPRHVHTVRLHRLMEEKRRLEIGARIKQLREGQALKQPQVADRVGTTLRNYQRWEAGGGTSYDMYERIANALGVSPEYILHGDDLPQAPTADLVSTLSRIESKLDRLLDHLEVPEVPLGPPSKTAAQVAKRAADRAGGRSRSSQKQSRGQASAKKRASG